MVEDLLRRVVWNLSTPIGFPLFVSLPLALTLLPIESSEPAMNQRAAEEEYGQIEKEFNHDGDEEYFHPCAGLSIDGITDSFYREAGHG